MTIDEALQALIAHGFGFVHLRNDSEDVVVVVGVRPWPGFYDRINLYSEDASAAARAPMDSRRGVDEVVWSFQGDVVTTIQELLALPKPHEPGAPRLSRRSPVGLWLPGPGLALPGAIASPP